MRRNIHALTNPNCQPYLKFRFSEISPVKFTNVSIKINETSTAMRKILKKTTTPNQSAPRHQPTCDRCTMPTVPRTYANNIQTDTSTSTNIHHNTPLLQQNKNSTLSDNTIVLERLCLPPTTVTITPTPTRPAGGAAAEPTVHAAVDTDSTST